MSSLYIELKSPSTEQSVRWWYFDTNTNEAGACALTELMATLQSKEISIDDVHVLLPDQDVLFMRVEVPGKSQSRIRQAAPYAVEPYLTEDIDDVHIALGVVKRDGRVPVAVINLDHFERYVRLLKELDIEPKVVTTLGLTVTEDGAICVFDVESAITLKIDDQMAVVQPDVAATLLSSALNDEHDNRAIDCVGSSSLADMVRQAVADSSSEEVEVKNENFADYLRSLGDSSGGINLLQGNFAVVDRSASAPKVLVSMFSAIAASLLLASGILIAQGLWAQVQISEMREQALDIYESVYRTRDVVGSPSQRMRELMGASLDRDSDWIVLLDAVAQSASTVDITNIDYNDSQNRMTITFYADNFEEFERLRTSMEENGMSIDVNVAEQQSNRVWARVSLSTS